MKLTTCCIFLLAFKSQNILAVGIPPHDLAGSLTLAKNDIPLEIGVQIELVSIKNECHYYGNTSVGQGGDIVIRVLRSTCGEIDELKGVASKPLNTSLMRGEIVWIPLDGFVQKIESTLNSIVTENK